MATKKMPAKKVPAKKAAPKKSGNSGSANAAEERARTNRYMSKKTSQNDYIKGEYSEGYDGPVRGGKKTAMDARKRDSKYGKLTGPTTVEGSQSPSRISQKQITQSLITSSRGNKYVVSREKTKRRFLPDSNSKARVEPYQDPKRTPTRTRTVRSEEGRLMRGAKTPTKRAAVKKRFN
jgi:ribosomal protein L28